MKVTLIGFTIPDNEIELVLKHDPNMPIQTHKFAWSVVRSMVKNDIEVDLISSHPVTNFPNGNKVFYKKQVLDNKWATGIILPFINILVLKHLTRFLSCLIYASPRVLRFKTDIVLIHGVHSPYLYFGLICKYFFKKNIVVILTDPPGIVNSTDTMLSIMFKKIDAFIIKKSLEHYDGAITLTDLLYKDFMSHSTKYIVIEGILDHEIDDDLIIDEASKLSDMTFLYAGGLNKTYGVELLLEAFDENIDNVRLKIFGRGPLETQVLTAAKNNTKIEFGGFISNLEVLEYLKNADILVNPRPSKQDFVKYSFPSKLIEYMSTGTPVLTTKLPCIPQDYNNYLYMIEDESVEGFAKAVYQLTKKSKEELNEMGKSARKYILNNKTESKQGSKIASFFQSIVDRK